jgi:hypothetical protein
MSIRMCTCRITNSYLQQHTSAYVSIRQARYDTHPRHELVPALDALLSRPHLEAAAEARDHL